MKPKWKVLKQYQKIKLKFETVSITNIIYFNIIANIII